MYKNYIVSLSWGFFAIFHEGSSIFLCKFDKTWKESEVLLKDTTANFHISIDDDSVYVISQNIDGFVSKTVISKGYYYKKYKLLYHIGSDVSNIYNFAVSMLDRTNIIYNIQNNNEYLLFSQIIGDKNSGAILIDKISPLANNLYHVVNINKRHCALFYVVNDKGVAASKTFGFREVFEDKVGLFKPVLVSHGQVLSCGYFVHDYVLHIMYSVSGLFGYSVVYKRFDNDGLSRDVVVANVAAEHFIMYIEDKMLKVAIKSGGTLYVFKCDEDLLTFSQESYSNIVQNVSKALYLSNNTEDFSVVELFVDTKMPWAILHKPELFMLKSVELELGEADSLPKKSGYISESDYNSFFKDIGK